MPKIVNIVPCIIWTEILKGERIVIAHDLHWDFKKM